MRLLAIVILLTGCPETPTRFKADSISLTWRAVDKTVLGDPIPTDDISYNVYYSRCDNPDKVEYIYGNEYKLSGIMAGMYVFQVTAVHQGIESAKSEPIALELY